MILMSKDVLLTMEFTCYDPIRPGVSPTETELVREAIALFKAIWLNPAAPAYRIEFSGKVIKPYHNCHYRPTLTPCGNRTGDDQGVSR